MKKSFISAVPVLLTVLFITGDLFADRIYLDTGVVVNGKVLRVTGDNVEYDPEGEKPFDMVPRKLVQKVVYDDGKEVVFNTGGTGIIPEERVQKDLSPGIRPVEEENRDFIMTDKFAFVEFECGWNGYVGLGARMDILLGNHFSLNGGLGFGLWGYRLSAGMRYHFNNQIEGPALGLGAAYNTGMDGFKMDGEIEDRYGNTEDDTIEFDLKPVTVINLTFLYSLRFSERTKIYFEAGYGIALTKDNYTYRAEDAGEDIVLEKSVKDLMDIMEPGGVIFSVGVAFLI